MATQKKNYQIGKGKVYFSLFKPNTQTPMGYRFLGNCPGFSLNIEIQTLDHYASTEGINEKDQSIITQVNRTGTLTSDEISTENVGLFFLGTSSTITQTSATAQTATIEDVIPGLLYEIGARKLSNVVVKVATVVKTLGTDYTVDLNRGTITPVVGGTITSGADITVEYDRATSTRNQVLSGTSQVEGAIWFQSNAPTGTVKNDLKLPYVKLSPGGDFSLITDNEWTQLQLAIEALVPVAGGSAIIVDGQEVEGV